MTVTATSAVSVTVDTGIPYSHGSDIHFNVWISDLWLSSMIALYIHQEIARMTDQLNRRTTDEDSGMTNPETLLIWLDITSNNGLPYLKFWQNHTRACITRQSDSTDYDPRVRLAHILKTHYQIKYDDGFKLTNKSTALPALGKVAVLGDLLSAALERVDYMQIAAHLVEQYGE